MSCIEQFFIIPFIVFFRILNINIQNIFVV